MTTETDKSTTDVLFIGAITARRPDWELYAALPEQQADAKKEAKRQEQLAEMTADAAAVPYQAYVAELSCLHYKVDQLGSLLQDTPTLVRCRGPLDGVDSPAAQFSRYVSENVVLAGWPPIPQFWGFGIRDVLRIIAADVSRIRRKHSDVPALPRSVWYHPTFATPAAYDPREVLVHSSTQKNVGIPQLLAFFGADVMYDLRDSFQSANCAEFLCRVGGLVG